MVVVEITYDDIKKLVNLPKKKVIDGLTDIGAPIEEIGDKLVVELTPNRPDLFFIEGMARALDSLYNSKTRKYSAKKSDYNLKIGKVEQRPYIRIAVVKGGELNGGVFEYLIEAQEKLHETIGRKRKKVAIGLHDADSVKFPIEYKAVDDLPFIPLEFEKEMKIPKILEEHPKGRVYGHLIKKPYPIIVDQEGVISMPPIINSERTKLTEKTKNVVLDVTGTHEETVDKITNMILCALADRGGEIYSVKAGKETYPDFEERKMKVDFDFVNKTLGVELKKEEIMKLLKKMGFESEKDNILIPPYRIDVVDKVDVVEDVAIPYGYNNFKPEMLTFFTEASLIRKYDLIDNVMRGMEFSEIKTSDLVNKNKLKELGYGEGYVEIKNPVSEDSSTIRPNMVLSILEVFGRNKVKGLPQKFYEIGDVHDEKCLHKRLVFGMVDKKIEFSDARGVLQTLMREIGLEFELKKGNLKVYDSEMSGEIIVKGKNIGVFGKIKKETLGVFGLEFPVYVCEINLDKII